MKAHVSRVIFGLAAFVLMRHQRQTADDGLDSHVVDPFLKEGDIHAIRLELLEDTGYRSLVTHSHVLTAVVEHEFGVVFIDSVVG